MKEILGRESKSSASSIALYETSIPTFLRKEMSSGLPESFFGSGEVRQKVAHSVSTENNQSIEKTARQRVMVET